MSTFAISEQDKPTLRAQGLAARNVLDARLRQEKSVALAGIGRAALDASVFCVSLYHSIGSELDPAPLMQSLAKQGASLALPVLLDRKTMVFRRWDPSRRLVPAGFGTLGPDEDQGEVWPDLIFAPLAAFSSTGQRIGYGKGHYDRVLSKMHAAGHVPALIGLAFDSQECVRFPVEDHDIPLDAVLTPSGLRVFDHGHDALSPFLAGLLPANQPE